MSVLDTVQETLFQQFLGGSDPSRRLGAARRQIMPFELIPGFRSELRMPLVARARWRICPGGSTTGQLGRNLAAAAVSLLFMATLPQALALWYCEWLDTYYDSCLAGNRRGIWPRQPKTRQICTATRKHPHKHTEAENHFEVATGASWCGTS